MKRLVPIDRYAFLGIKGLRCNVVVGTTYRTKKGQSKYLTQDHSWDLAQPFKDEDPPLIGGIGMCA